MQAAATEFCIKQNHRQHYGKLSPFPEGIRSSQYFQHNQWDICTYH